MLHPQSSSLRATTDLARLQAEAPPQPLLLHRLQGPLGNGAWQACLGESLGAFGQVVMDSAWLELAGLPPQAGPGAESNRATQAVMRLCSSPEADEGALAGLRLGGGRPLPEAVLQRMESALGHNFAGVRIHTDARAAQLAQAAGARAFAVGSEIWFNLGEYAPGTPEGDKLLLHELTHVVQADEGRLPRPSGPGKQLSSPSDPHEQEADRVAAALAPALYAESPALEGEALMDEEAWAAAVGTSPLGEASSFISASAEPGEDPGVLAAGGLALLRKVAPELASLLAQGPRAFVERALMPKLQGLLSRSLDSLALEDVMQGLNGSMQAALDSLRGAAEGDPGCCAGFFAAVEGLRELGEALLNNPAVDLLSEALGGVSSSVAELLQLALASTLDQIPGLLGAVGDPVSGMAEQLFGWLDGVQSLAGDLLGMVLERLGLPQLSLEAVIGWVSEQAGAVWTSMQAQLAPVLGPLQQISQVISSLSPLGQLMGLVRLAPQILNGVQFLWEHRDDPDLLAQAHAQLGDTVLPQLLELGLALRGAWEQAFGALGAQAQGLSQASLALLQSLSGVPLLGVLGPALGELTQGAEALWTWTLELGQGAGSALSQLVERVQQQILPWQEVLCSLGLALSSPSLIPVIVSGWAWQELPDCTKGPLLDLLLDAAIGVLSASPELPIFGLLWPVLRGGVLGFLQGVRGQTLEIKLAVAQRIAHVLSGGSTELLFGFGEGLARGLWEGLRDPFVLAASAVSGLGELLRCLEQGETPEVLALAADLAEPVAQVLAGFGEALSQHLGERDLSALMLSLGEGWDGVMAAVQGSGQDLAARACAFFLGPEAESALGEDLGWLAGTVAFEVLLGLATAGSWTAMSGTLRTLARVLDWTGELMGLLGRLGDELLQGVRSLGRIVGDSGLLRSLLDTLEGIGLRLHRQADELGQGRHGDELGDEALTEGAQRADVVEKQRVALEAKLVLDTLLALGQPLSVAVDELQVSFMARYPWIKDFRAEARGQGWSVYLIASKVLVKEVKDPEQEQRSRAGAAVAAQIKRYVWEAGEAEAVKGRVMVEVKEALSEVWAMGKAQGDEALAPFKQMQSAADEIAGRRVREAAEKSAVARAERVLAEGKAVDPNQLTPEARKAFEDYQQGLTGQRARTLSQELAGLDERGFLAHMEEEVRAGRCPEPDLRLASAEHIGSDQTQMMRVWEYPDGTTVRYKPKGDKYREVSYSVEVKVDPSVADAKVGNIQAFKLDTDGRPVPCGPESGKSSKGMVNPYEKQGKDCGLQFNAYVDRIMEAGHHVLAGAQG